VLMLGKFEIFIFLNEREGVRGFQRIWRCWTDCLSEIEQSR
jgi:hypothetical protein